jgi:hypothetical protein
MMLIAFLLLAAAVIVAAAGNAPRNYAVIALAVVAMLVAAGVFK